MDIDLDWTNLKSSKSFHDKRKALSVLESLPNLEIQEHVIAWFEKSKSLEVKNRLFLLLTQESKIEILKNQSIYSLIGSIDDSDLKRIIIDFTITRNYLKGFKNSGILWIIKEYMNVKQCELSEAREKVELFWIENRQFLKK